MPIVFAVAMSCVTGIVYAKDSISRTATASRRTVREVSFFYAARVEMMRARSRVWP